MPGESDAAKEAAAAQEIPLGRMGRKWDIAMGVLFLASPAAGGPSEIGRHVLPITSQRLHSAAVPCMLCRGGLQALHSLSWDTGHVLPAGRTWVDNIVQHQKGVKPFQHLSTGFVSGPTHWWWMAAHGLMYLVQQSEVSCKSPKPCLRRLCVGAHAGGGRRRLDVAQAAAAAGGGAGGVAGRGEQVAGGWCWRRQQIVI